MSSDSCWDFRARVGNVSFFCDLFLGLRSSGEECFSPSPVQKWAGLQHSVLAGALPLFEIPDASVWLEG